MLGEKKRNERQASALDGIPCGSTYPKCKFIKDAYVAKANIPANESDIEILEGKKSECEEKKMSYDAVEAQKHIDR